MWVKICGIQDVESAIHAVDCGASAIGLNFHAPSVRCIDPDVATDIVSALPDHVDAVGVFVEQSPEMILDLCDETGIGTIQLHGDQSDDFVMDLLSRDSTKRIILARRIGIGGFNALQAALESLQRFDIRPDACLVDAYIDGVWGGSGELAPWDLVARDYQRLEWPHLILAGGLTDHNVADAILTVRPWGVDVASGVESSLGIKSRDRIARFLEQALNVDPA